MARPSGAKAHSAAKSRDRLRDTRSALLRKFSTADTAVCTAAAHDGREKLVNIVEILLCSRSRSMTSILVARSTV